MKVIFSYAFQANGSRYAGIFAVEAKDEEEPDVSHMQATGMGVTVRSDPENPDSSILEDGFSGVLSNSRDPTCVECWRSAVHR